MDHREESKWDGVDVLLLAAIGILSITVLLLLFPMAWGWWISALTRWWKLGPGTKQIHEMCLSVLNVHWCSRWVWTTSDLVVLTLLAWIRVRSRARADYTRQRRLRCWAVDLLLLLTVAALPGLCFWPPVETGNDWPRPGAQVCRQYVNREGGVDAVVLPVNYLLYLPAKYEESRRWPLVVYLHGSGAAGENLIFVREEGLPRQIEEGKQFPFLLLSPQCSGSGWDPALVVELIEHLSSTLPVDRERVYLTGCSMGGFGTWRVATYDPGRFAAISPLCGGGDVTQAERLVDIPVWAFHGAQDGRVPLALGKEMVDAVRKHGGHVRFTVYPDYGHDIDQVTYRNEQLYEWLLHQRRSRPLKRIPATTRTS